MATDFVVNKADLEFILRQIRIAEATSLAYDSTPVSTVQAIVNEYGIAPANATISPFGLRTVDGTNNSLVANQSHFGAADTVFPRLTDPVFRDETTTEAANPDSIDFDGPGPGAPLVQANYGQGGNVVDADPRIISNLIVDMTAGNPAAVLAALKYSVFTGAITEDQVAAAAAAIAAAYARTKSTGPADVADLSDDAASAVVAAIDVIAATLFGAPINQVDIDSALAARTAAETAHAKALLVVDALTAAGLGAGDPAWDDANAVATNAAALVTALTNYHSSLALGNTVEVGDEITAVSNAADMALANEAAAQALTVQLEAMVFTGTDPVASAQAHADLAATLTSYGVEYDSAEGSFVGGLVGSLVIPNLSPDIGLSPGFNAWMTFFGQFFDHGLDLVTKGGNGTVYVPLQADDPLIAGVDGRFGTADDLPAHLRFMALTRATPLGNGQENTTTSLVDQNQTYTSHASHQVFLREYVMTANGAVSTGKMLDGSTASGSVAGAIGNWAEVKAQALDMLGIMLTDFDVHNVPLLLTDQYGKFIPVASGPNAGFAQMIVSAGADGILNTLDDVVKEGTAAGATVTSDVLRTHHAFLNDIAHHAAPGMFDSNADHIPDAPQSADTDMDANGNGIYDAGDTLTDVNGDGFTTTADFFADDHVAGTYDDEMLNSHMVTGDGRGNENIALTTVHSIFHSEHNRLVDANKATITASALTDPAFVKEWLLNDATANMNDPSTWVWDGERLFQAARFATEMQYQHMVFEEFARRIQPAIDPFIFNTSPNVDPSILAEFAHTVYRFGHSMLTGTVDRLDNNLDLLNGDTSQKTLLAVFLNPQQYFGSGDDLATINANIVRGLSRDVGNAMDEFIVQDVRSNLLGLPLDLAMFNLSRGRETGIPSLNQTRAQLYDDTGLADLKPYESWADFALNIKNAASVVNFIAAYGTHSLITAETTLAGKRAVAEELVFGFEADGTTPSDITDRLAFLNSTGAWANNPNGSTTTGLDVVDFWIGGLAERNPEFGGMLGTTFNYVFEFQMESLQFGDRFYYLSRTQGTNFLNNLEPNTFADIVMRNTDLSDQYSTHLNGQLFVTPDYIIELDRGIAQMDYNGLELGNDPLADDPILGAQIQRDYTDATATYSGVGTHDVGGYLRVVGGNHYVLGGTEGADRIYGDSGMDTLWGDGGDDYLNGGTEADDVFGGAGNDVIEDPFGEGDVLRGNDGNDVVTSGGGADLLFGNAGQDYIVLGADAAEVFGGEGTDFILGGAGKDFLMGNEGSDWIEGGAGFDTIAGENTELFFNSPIIGHDVLFGHGDETDYDAESGDDIMASGPSVFRYEGMFGFDWAIGKGDLHSGVNFDLFIPVFTTIPEDILRDRFDKVEALSGWNYSDILDGDDRGHKGGGSSAPDSTPTVLFTDDVLTQEGVDRINGFNTWFAGARNTLFGAATPIPGTTSLPATSYRDGNILMGGDGNDFLRGRGGYDLLDGDAYLNVRIKIVLSEAKVVNGVTYAVGTVLSAESMTSDVSVAGEYAGKVYNTNADGSPNFASVAFGGRSLTSLMLDRTINPGDMSIVREILDGTVSYVSENFNGGDYNSDDGTWTQNWTESGGETPTSPTTGDIQIIGNRLNFGSGTDGGENITRAVDLTGKTTATLSFSWEEDDRDTGENVLVQALNLTTNAFETIGTMAGSADNGTGTASFNLTSAQIGTNSAIRFQTTGAWGTGENFYIDNVTIGEHPTDNDTAIFQGTRAEYDIEGITNTTEADDSAITYSGSAADVNGDGFISVRDRDTGAVGAIVWQIIDGNATEVQLTSSRGALTDDLDLLKNIETLRFADQTIQIGGNNNLATGTVTINDPTPYDLDGLPGTPPLVTPYVGQVLTATLSNFADLDGIPLVPVGQPNAGMPVGLTFEWQTTETGGNAGWAKITTGDTYTVRSVDPGHILRAVAIFQDSNGVTETITSAATDGATAAFSVNENSANNTVVAASIPFNPDYDPDQQPGGPTDGDIVVLTHVLADSAGGRFKIVTVGGVQQLQVANGALLNYEAPVHTPANQSYQFVDNQYQVVIDSYIDAASAAALDPAGRIASRQFTILLNDVTGEPIDMVPTVDLHADATTTTTGSYADNFNTSAFNNSTGTTPWTPPWVETGDNSGTNSPSQGQIWIDNGVLGQNVLHFNDDDNDALLGTATIQRAVNLAGVTSATVNYSFDENGFDTGEIVTVTFSDDGTFSAGHIQTIQVISGTSGSGNTSVALTGSFTANAAIRFVVSGTNDNSTFLGVPLDHVNIENLNIATSTTTIVPGTPGNDYTAVAFTEGGAAVAIASNPAVTNDSTTIMSATIKLTNAQAQDVLAILGALPVGITSSFGPAVPGQITMYLTGNATLAAYQTAIQAVRFSNGGDNPNPTAGASPRTIQVTVNDGVNDSLIATATVTVNAVDDLTVANGDSIVTNTALGTAFIVPEWALLANDVDPDNTLDVTALPTTTGLTTSLVTNPGSVTITDTAPANGSFTYTAGGSPTPVNANVTVAQSVASTTLSETFGSTSYTDNDGAWTENWTEVGDNGGSGGNITITGGALNFNDGVATGQSISRAINLTGATSATLNFNWNEAGADVGENILVQAFNGTTWDTLGTLAATAGNASGNPTFTLSAAQIGPHSAIRFESSGGLTAGETFNIDNINVTYTAPSTNILAGAGTQILVGDINGSTFTGGTGNDIVLAGGGNDTIIWNVGDGRDIVDGGLAGTDTFVVNGDGSVETYRVYARADAIAAGITGLAANSDIVITRNGTNNASVIAELDEIEEITINTGGGADIVLPIGNFAPTNLSFNTITINDGEGDDTVDVSGLDSEHHVVFNTGGGTGTFIGQRDQDELNNTSGGPTGGDTGGDGEDDDIDDTDDNDDDEEGTGQNTGATGNAALALAVYLGTGADDTYVGGAGHDTLAGEGGDDTLFGLDGNDNVAGGAGADQLIGGAGDDILIGNGGNDMILAGAGKDTVLAGSGDDTVFGDDGDDLIFGNEGHDVINGGAGNDTTFASAGDGNDAINGGDGSDTLDLEAITASLVVDLGSSGIGSSASTESGNDTLSGIENVKGGSGNDTIIASNSVNVLDGGGGDDTFVFKTAAAANGDTIEGFQPGDTIDLRPIYNSLNLGNTDGFDIVADFNAAGQLKLHVVGEDTIIEGNTDNDNNDVDFSIKIAGRTNLTSSDFG